MKATKIKTVKGQTLSLPEMNTLAQYIVAKCAAKGFITEAEVLTQTTMKIGLRMRSFRVNTAKLGHNARIGRRQRSIKGYTRTDVPTWDQRKEFNHIVNAALNKFKVQAQVVSGNYTVRTLQGPVTSWSYGGDRGAGVAWSADACTDICTEAEARIACDSKAKERSHKRLLSEERRTKKLDKYPTLKLVQGGM